MNCLECSPDPCGRRIDSSTYRRRYQLGIVASPFMVLGRAFAFNERLDVGYERYDDIRIEVACTRRFGSEVNS